MHYQVFSTRGRTATGESYENTSKCWDDLNGAAKAARYLGLVDAEAFTDARNDPPRIHVRPRDEEPLPAVTLETGEMAAVHPDRGRGVHRRAEAVRAGAEAGIVTGSAPEVHMVDNVESRAGGMELARMFVTLSG